MKANLLETAPETSAEYDTGLQQQVQLSRELSFEQDLLIDREARIRQIEEDVIDVNQIMRELSCLVHEQGEHIGTQPRSKEAPEFMCACVFRYDWK